MRTRVQKWGNSLAIRIPKSFAAELGAESGAEFELTVERGRLVLAPVEQPAYSLAELLARVSAKNRHAEQVVGAPLGREVW